MRHAQIQQEFLKYAKTYRLHRAIGSTAMHVFPFGLGGQALLETEEKEAEVISLVRKALDLGVNYFDTAPMYGPSRYYLGKALGVDREYVILASKVYERSYTGAKKELDESFDLLKTDFINLVQLHGMEKESDKRALQKNGSLQLLLDAQRAGKIEYIGVTGHHNSRILIDCLDAYDFDTVLLPINPATPEFDSVLDICIARHIGIIGMKVMSRGILPLHIPYEKILANAYDKCDVAIIGCSSNRDVERNVAATMNHFKVDISDMSMSDEVRQEAAFFSEHSNARWPKTYQPNLPTIDFEDE